jgi:hypothetical protein
MLTVLTDGAAVLYLAPTPQTDTAATSTNAMGAITL